jgi:Domain of unknown function (DUF4338)/DDE_Tnp_1-associated
MKAQKTGSNQAMAPVVTVRGLRVMVLSSRADVARFDALLADEHWLGATRSVGRFMRQVVADDDGHWAGLLAWGPAAMHLQDRDKWVGWDAARRATRLNLVVQNRRFLVPEATRRPNLASQVLGAAIRALPEQWQATFGYAPLLAETFTDPEAHAGTCYRASGWQPLGFTAGFGRHRRDFYVNHRHPKCLWIRELAPQARGRLCAPQLTGADAAAATTPLTRELPLDEARQESLLEVLRRLPDPRAGNWTFPMPAVLGIVTMALLCGHQGVKSFMRFGQRLTNAQRRTLGLPRREGTNYRPAPSYKVYYNLLRTLDLEAFAHVLSAWLQSQRDTLPVSLALDGKMIRDQIGLVSLVEHDTGAVVAMAPMRHKEGDSPDGEITVGRKLLADHPPPTGSLITADSLHTQKHTLHTIVAAGSDYLVQVKDNQPTLHKRLHAAFDGRAPLLTSLRKTPADS